MFGIVREEIMMDRTLPTITLKFQRLQKAFDGFPLALKRSK